MHHKVCGLTVHEKDLEKRFCILHSKDTEKDKAAFTEALKRHPEDEKRSLEEAVFLGATFSGQTHFSGSQVDDPIFLEVKANFESISIKETGALTFRAADLSNCRFLTSDVW